MSLANELRDGFPIGGRRLKAAANELDRLAADLARVTAERDAHQAEIRRLRGKFVTAREQYAERVRLSESFIPPADLAAYHKRRLALSLGTQGAVSA